MIGDFLYEPSSQDYAKSATAPQRCGASDFLQQNNTLVFVTYGPVPLDRILVVSAASLYLLPGASQVALRGEVAVVTENSLTQLLATAVEAAADGRCVLETWSPAILMPGESLQFRGTFNLSTAANELRSGWNGLLLPRGNLQFGSLARASS